MTRPPGNDGKQRKCQIQPENPGHNQQERPKQNGGAPEPEEKGRAACQQERASHDSDGNQEGQRHQKSQDSETGGGAAPTSKAEQNRPVVTDNDAQAAEKRNRDRNCQDNRDCHGGNALEEVGVLC